MRLIDADSLFEKVKESSENAGFYKPIYDGFLAGIVNAPTIEQPTWISVENRLPTENGKYLTMCKFATWRRYSPMYHSIEFFSTEFGAWLCDGEKRHGVLYWMPLPKPPKGD